MWSAVMARPKLFVTVYLTPVRLTVSLASASKAIILGFNVRPEQKAAQLAEKEGVEIRLYTIIYEAINDMREAMEGLLAPTEV